MMVYVWPHLSLPPHKFKKSLWKNGLSRYAPSCTTHNFFYENLLEVVWLFNSIAGCTLAILLDWIFLLAFKNNKLEDLYRYKFLQRSRGVYGLGSPALRRRYTNSIQITLLLRGFILILMEIIFFIRSRTFQPLRYIQPYRRILQSHRLSASRQSIYCHINCYITYSNYGTAMWLITAIECIDCDKSNVNNFVQSIRLCPLLLYMKFNSP